MRNVESLFSGEFFIDAKKFEQRLRKIKAYVFDWDGVFNNGHKNESGSSSFSETDAMGINLLRFSHYLASGNLPFTAIISGENNKAAAFFAEREHINAVYSTKNKPEALEHFCKGNKVKPGQVVFFFDDVLDFPVAANCGLRVMVRNEAGPLTSRYAQKKGLVDYLTHETGSSNAVRESAELIMGMNGQFDNALKNRINYSEKYNTYLVKRNSAAAQFFTAKDL